MHARAVHTPAATPFAPLIFRSTKFPLPIATLPVAVQLEFDVAVQARTVFAIAPGTPCRSVTVIAFACWEYIVSFVAVHPAGTHVSTDPPLSVDAEFELFTE